MTNPRVVPQHPEFYGTALMMSPRDYVRAAKRLGCEPAAIKAVAEQESGGGSGFLPDRRPKILFEALHFGNATGHRWDSSYPEISSPIWDRTLYRRGAHEYDRLYRAVRLDRAAALGATSWGKFQILGENHTAAGFSTVEAYVAAICESEGRQLDAFVSFVTADVRMVRALQQKDWATFALIYNGRSYRKNQYDVSMARLYRNFASDSTLRDTLPVLHVP